MNEESGKQPPKKEKDYPRASTRKERPKLSPIWVAPVCAAVIGALLIYRGVVSAGPTIEIRFKDGSGVRAGQTELRHRGVKVGDVTSVRLDPDLAEVIVEVRLEQFADNLAVQGSEFWIVRPEISLSKIQGLGTIMTGPYIQARPGNGEPAFAFSGLSQAPIGEPEQSLRLVLKSSDLAAVNMGSPVLYRGLEIGAVTDYALAEDSNGVLIEASIRDPYHSLVRRNSRFWKVGGLSIDINLFGSKADINSLKSIFKGAVKMATPPPKSAGETVSDGAVFELHEEHDKDWLEWAPSIPIPAPQDPGEEQIKKEEAKTDQPVFPY